MSIKALILPGGAPCPALVATDESQGSTEASAAMASLGIESGPQQASDGYGLPVPDPDAVTPAEAVPPPALSSSPPMLMAARKPTAMLARQPLPDAPQATAPAAPAPSPAAIDPCDLAAVPSGSISQFEYDIRDGKRWVTGAVLDPHTDEIIGYYRTSVGVWSVMDREGNAVDGGEPGVEAPLVDPIDFVPTPGAIIKGVSVVGRAGLKVLGKLVAKGATKKTTGGIATVGAAALGKMQKKSAEMITKAAEKEAATKAASVAAAAAAKRVTGQIAYGSTDLAQKAVRFRIAQGLASARNVAVFEYVQGGVTHTIEMASARGVGHSERLIAKELEKRAIDPKTVTRIYSELEPCVSPGGYCKALIGRTFPQAAVTYSFEYGATAQSRSAGVAALKEAISKILSP